LSPWGVQVYVGLGSNLNDPVAQVRQGLRALAQLPRSRLVQASRLYCSPPMGPPDQPDYINAVAALDTALEPEPLLDALQAIEVRQGRRRGVRWGARTLDLDILLYGSRCLSGPRLNVPHPGLDQRAFVIHPLAEIAPEAVVPGRGTVAELARHCPKGGLQLLDQ